jgi:hypothetical protein
MSVKVPGQRSRITRIECDGNELSAGMGPHHGVRGRTIDVRELNLVSAGFG